MKKLLSILLSVAMLLSVTSLTVFADETDISLTSSDSVFAGGSGTEDDPYQVSTPEQLNEVRNYLDKHFVQINNIDMTAATSEGGTYWNDGTGWIPIGTYNTPFTGKYDGHGFKIIGLNIYKSTPFVVGSGYYTETNQMVGLFGYLENGIIENIVLIDGEYKINSESSSKSTYYIGGFVAYGNYIGSEINNCINYNNIYVQNCNHSHLYVGGISSLSWGSISRCYNYGNISIDNITSFYLNCGGICGYIPLSSESGGTYTIEESANHGTITASLAKNGRIGGICGASYMGTGVIMKCYNSGNIYVSIGDTTATDIVIGGVSGDCFKLNNCYNSGNVDIDIESKNFNVGGLIGFAEKTVTNSYNIGQIDGDGLVGSKKSSATINNCYTINDAPTEINNTTTKNLSNDEMTIKNSFEGFDFDTVWNISTNINNGMPYLRALYKTPPNITVGGISFNVRLEEDTYTGHLLAALYDENGVLQNVKKYIAEENITVTFDKGKTGSYAKIFWWDDIGSMKPLCDTQTIQLQ